MKRATRFTGRLLRPGAVAALITIAALAAVADTYRTLSHTWDEPSHLANGLSLLDRGTYYFEHQHPPLARVAMAVGPFLDGVRSAPPPAVLGLDDFWGRMIQGFDEGRRILYQSNGYDRVLTLARAGILPFLVLALAATYAWSRQLLGAWPAVAALFFVAATPIVLGNAGIATLDVPLAALALASLVVFCRWLDHPRAATAAALGAVTGLAIMAKFSAIPFLGVSFLAIGAWYSILGLRKERRLLIVSRAHLRTAAVAAAVLMVVCWLSYGGGFVSIADPANRPYKRVDDVFGAGTTANRIVSATLELEVVPYFLWELKQGTDDLRYHNRIGHLSYLLGERGEQGWWHYYLVGLGVRTPLPLLAAGLLGLALMLYRSARTGDWRPGAPALTFVAVLLFASVYSRINLGTRHILLLYPLLGIGSAYVVARLAGAGARRPLALAAAAVLLLSQLSSAVLAHPDHVSYFNVLAGSSPERFLISADLDWGQDMKRLERELRVRGIRKFALSYYGSNDLSRHDLPGYSPLEPNTPTTGWIALSVWRLYRNDDYSWLRAHEPVARIGTSINLYHIDDAED